LTIWKPDTCDCIIEYDSNVNFIKTRKRCNEPSHINASGASHLSVLQAHNRAFNLKHGKTPTIQQEEEMSQDKANEKARIRKIT